MPKSGLLIAQNVLDGPTSIRADQTAQRLTGEPFSQTQPIWYQDPAHSPTSPAPHGVGLFRQHFTLDTALDQATLSIFADPRYEVWVDGHWISKFMPLVPHKLSILNSQNRFLLVY